jgi:hypothetical protein
VAAHSRPPEAPSHHPIQLVSVNAVRATFDRRRRGPTESKSQLALELREARLIEWNPELHAFACQVSMRIQVAVLDVETFEARATFVGRFVSSIPVSRSTARAFISRQGLYLLWPFARPVIDGFARTAGVTVPMLPMFVVPGRTMPPQPPSE